MKSNFQIFNLKSIRKDKKFNNSFYETLFVFVFFAIVVAIFFYPIFRGEIPFPGDTLVGYYAPYNSISYGGYVPGAVPNKAQGPDVIRELYPWKHFVIDSYKQLTIPFWNPYNFSGNPLMADFQSGAFNLFNFIFFLFSFNTGWTIFIFIIPLLSAFFLYLFMREVGISRWPSIFSGLIFAFCGYMVVWMEYGNIGQSFMFLPLAFYYTEKILKKNYVNYYFLIAVLTVSLLAGYIQGYFYMTAIMVFYFIGTFALKKQFPVKKIVVYVFTLIIPILLSLFQFLPTLQLFGLSTRGNYSLDTIQKLLNPLWYAITVVAPDFFGNPATRNHWFYGTYIERVSYFGIIPLLFAVYALFFFRKRSDIKLFGIILGISFFLSYDFFVTKFFYLIPIPVLSTTVPTRILSLFAFSGAVLAGIGLDLFLQNRDKKKFLYSAGIIFSFLLFGWLIVIMAPHIIHQEWVSNVPTSKRNLILPTILLVAASFLSVLYLIKKMPKYVLIFVVIILTSLDLFRFFQKITPFSPTTYVYPETPVIKYLQDHGGINRFWGYGTGHIDTNFQIYDHTFSTDGNDALHLMLYTAFVESSKNGTPPDPLPRMDANVVPGFGGEDLPNNYYRQKVLNILGVKYVLQKNEILGQNFEPDFKIFKPSVYKIVWQVKPWQIYENLQAAPRFFLTADYVVEKTKQDVLKKFYDKNFNEKKTLILEDNPELQKQSLKENQTKLISYSPNKVVIQTKANGDALLFLSDSYYPDWKATVDGNKSKVYVADYAFRAVKVPKGKHTVIFYYDSSLFKIGIITSSIFFFFVAFSSIIVRKNKLI